MKRVHTQLMASSALALTLCFGSYSYAQTAISTIDSRANAQEETTRQSQELLKNIEAAEEAKAKENEIDREEAAQSLEEDEQSESSGLSTGILGKLPSEENMAKIASKMANEPNNLDHYFEYAQMADSLGKYDVAAETYERMLALAPNLHRVRLDLGATYLRLGRFEDAKNALEQVLENPIPDNVRPNAERVLAQVNEELREHDFSGSLTIGTNWDSNGNSAPKGKSILVLDTPIDLSGDALEQKDFQFFGALSANHTYRPRWAQSEEYSRRWKTSASHYRTKQSSLESLNIQVFSLKTGPEFKSNASGLTVNPNLSYSQIVLAGQTYLRSSTADINITYPVAERVILNGSHKTEWRRFDNSSDVSTYEDRDGIASEFSFGATVIASEKDIINASITHRRERTKQEYYDNEQIGGTLAYTRVLPYDSFANLSLGYKSTVYDDADSLISSKTRHDKEASAGLTLGHKLADELTATLGYTYKNVQSNIPNYEYDNHRVAATLTYSF